MVSIEDSQSIRLQRWFAWKMDIQTEGSVMYWNGSILLIYTHMSKERFDESVFVSKTKLYWNHCGSIVNCNSFAIFASCGRARCENWNFCRPCWRCSFDVGIRKNEPAHFCTRAVKFISRLIRFATLGSLVLQYIKFVLMKLYFRSLYRNIRHWKSVRNNLLSILLNQNSWGMCDWERNVITYDYR